MNLDDYQAGAASTWGRQVPDKLIERLHELGVPQDIREEVLQLGERLTLATLGLGLSGEAGEVSDEIKKFVGHGHWKDGFDAEKELGDVLWYVATTASALGLNLTTIAHKNLIKLGVRYEDGFSTEASKARVDLEDPAMDDRSLRAIQFRSQTPNSLRLTSSSSVYSFLRMMKDAGANILPADDAAVPSKGWSVYTAGDEVAVNVEISLTDFRNSSDPRNTPSKEQWDALLSNTPAEGTQS